MAKKKMGARLEQAMPQPSKPDHDFETEDNLRTMMKAHEIMHDDVKMGKVHKLAGRHKKAISSIADLKAKYDEKYGSGARQKKLADMMDGDGDE